MKERANDTAQPHGTKYPGNERIEVWARLPGGKYGWQRATVKDEHSAVLDRGPIVSLCRWRYPL